MRKVSNTILSFLARFTNRNTLPTLKARRMLVASPTFTLVEEDTVIKTIEPSTIIKSNTFQPSLKYPAPKAPILIKASIIKMIVKVKFNCSRTKEVLSLCPYHFRGSSSELIKIQIRIDVSKCFML